jgi:thiol-disulfide isomerase/thioredoxin
MRWFIPFGLLALILLTLMSACAAPAPASTLSPAIPTSPPSTATSPPTPSLEATATLLPEEDPPPGAEGEFSTDFSKHSVPYSDILSGGPSKDGIPAIDTPKFVSIAEAGEWLSPQEAILLVQVDGDARAYPIQILMWHEIVNDTVGELPLAVTFCPLCNTGIAFERTLDGQVLDFGTTGRLRASNLVMYDRQTESWWQQATGEAIAGELTGRQLPFIPAAMISWENFKAAYPEGQVLSRETGHDRDYGRNPYAGYDDVNGFPFLFDGQAPNGVLPPMARVIAVDLNGEAVAYPYDALEDVSAVNDTVGGVPIVVLWVPGTASALDAGTVDGGRDVGAAVVFSRELDGQTLTFVADGDRIVDEQTGSEWNVLGRAMSGPQAGSQLASRMSSIRIVGVNHFWFSWATFRPETRLYGAEDSGAEETTSTTAPTAPEGGPSELAADFRISVYQGEDVLGGQSVAFSELFAQGKPVVLNFWAGLCPLCRAEMPDLQAVHDNYGDRVLVVAVDIGAFIGLGSQQDALAMLDDLQITFPAGTTPDLTVMRDYQVLGTPATYFFKPSGELFKQWNGVIPGDQLNSYVEALLEVSE